MRPDRHIAEVWKRGITLILCAALMLLTLPASLAETDGAADASGVLPCEVTLPERVGDVGARIQDGDTATYATFGKGESVSIALPAAGRWVYIVWYGLPGSPSLTFYGAAGEAVRTDALDDTLLYVCAEIPSGASYAELTASGGFTLSDIAVYEVLPDMLLLPERCPETADVLLVTAHTGDECLSFGGLLPILAGEKERTVAVVFLSDQGRLDQEEAMRSLRASGVNIQPVFAQLPYRRYISDSLYASYIWKPDAVLSALVPVIRRVQPEILVTHASTDLGEEGGTMHAYAGQSALLAAEAAAGNEFDGASLAQYGVWQVKRVYQCAAAESDVMLPVDTQLPAFEGLTARAVSQNALDGYSMLAMYHRAAAETPYYSLGAAGIEAPLNDPMLDLSIDPMPTPTPEPTPEPTPTPAPDEAKAEPEADADAGSAARLKITGAVQFFRTNPLTLLVVGGLISAFFVLLTLLSRRAKKGARIAWSLLPLLLSAALAFAFPPAYEALEAKYAPTPTPTLAPTPEPTPTPTPEATPVPTAEPEQAASGVSDAWFCAEGEDEWYTFDAESGKGSYRSGTLSVEITRYDYVDEENKPIRYYVTHLRLRGTNEYRTAFGSYRENGRDQEEPWVMARQMKAVLAITGDNMIHSDQEKKGVIIRNGQVYLNNAFEDTMALSEDGMSMQIVPAGTLSAQTLLELGVRETFSFGPTLLRGGELNADMTKHRVRGRNPRVGVGTVEDGHFVIIVVEGRVSKYSYGVDVQTFAEMFVKEGCTDAYNLDGGASASLVFMGEYVNKRASKQTRNLPDMLTWGYSTLVPGEDEPLVNLPYYTA